MNRRFTGPALPSSSRPRVSYDLSEFDVAAQEPMNRYVLIVIAVVVIVMLIALTMYRRARRGPPGSSR